MVVLPEPSRMSRTTKTDRCNTHKLIGCLGVLTIPVRYHDPDSGGASSRSVVDTMQVIIIDPRQPSVGDMVCVCCEIGDAKRCKPSKRSVHGGLLATNISKLARVVVFTPNQRFRTLTLEKAKLVISGVLYSGKSQ